MLESKFLSFPLTFHATATGNKGKLLSCIFEKVMTCNKNILLIKIILYIFGISKIICRSRTSLSCSFVAVVAIVGTQKQWRLK